MLYDYCIVGGGIVGLAVAYTIINREPGTRLIILEKEPEVGQHQSSHNSGVIHSGVYYKEASLKAQNCVKGVRLLTQFCQQFGVPFEICGKLIAAVDISELDRLEALKNRGIKNGLSGLRFLSSQEIKEKEPHLQCVKALWVPQAGIVNFLNVCLELKDQLLKSGAQFQFSTTVQQIIQKKMAIIESNRGSFQARIVINCAGLYSDDFSKEPDIKILPFRGEYYTLNSKSTHLVKNLIYPVPNPKVPFLGVHFTRRINGEIDLGPNAVLAFAKEGYTYRDISMKEIGSFLSFPGFWKLGQNYFSIGLREIYHSLSKKAFMKSLQNYIPEIRLEDMLPTKAGVRAMAVNRKGQLVDDFVIKRKKSVIHLINTPSPAATSCFAIAELLFDLLD